jgi:hypothetical protein
MATSSTDDVSLHVAGNSSHWMIRRSEDQKICGASSVISHGGGGGGGAICMEVLF